MIGMRGMNYRADVSRRVTRHNSIARDAPFDRPGGDGDIVRCGCVYRLDAPVETYVDGVEPQPGSYDPPVDVDYLHGGDIQLADASAVFSQKGRETVYIDSFMAEHGIASEDELRDQDLLHEFLAQTEDRAMYPADPDAFKVVVDFYASDEDALSSAVDEFEAMLPDAAHEG